VAQVVASRAKGVAERGDQSATAQLVTDAMLLSARAQVDQKKAGLVQAQADLEHTTIRAPVNGVVVVSRAVDVGRPSLRACRRRSPLHQGLDQDGSGEGVDGRHRAHPAQDRVTFTVDSFPARPSPGCRRSAGGPGRQNVVFPVVVG
jgi:HlyD family secretion protein